MTSALQLRNILETVFQAGWMLLVEQKLLIFPGNLSSILVFSWALYWGKNSKKKKLHVYVISGSVLV
jgi:hypothetical protein